ncbi:hypothetical protein BFL21_05980 [Escherichia coli]|nr:hypothetical protein BFL21_05980 [Escherichia coli]
MLPSETMIWQPEFTDKTLSRKPGAVHCHICELHGHVGCTKNVKRNKFFRTLETKKPPQATYRRRLYLQIFIIKVDALSLVQ